MYMDVCRNTDTNLEGIDNSNNNNCMATSPTSADHTRDSPAETNRSWALTRAAQEVSVLLRITHNRGEEDREGARAKDTCPHWDCV